MVNEFERPINVRQNKKYCLTDTAGLIEFIETLKYVIHTNLCYVPQVNLFFLPTLSPCSIQIGPGKQTRIAFLLYTKALLRRKCITVKPPY